MSVTAGSMGSEGQGWHWLDQPVAITSFPRKWITTGQVVETTWRELVALLGTPLEGYAEKDLLPLWAPTVFDGNRRNKDGVLRVHALGFDDDKVGSWEEALPVWARFAGVLHGTWKDSIEKPSRRAVLALTRPVSVAEYETLWRWFAMDLAAGGHPIGIESSDASRQWFRPALRPGGVFRFAVLPGEPIDVDAVLALRPVPRAAKKPRPDRESASRPSAGTGTGAGAGGSVGALLDDLGTVAELLGVEPLRSVSGGSVRCPFHEERTPSFSLFRSDRGGWAGCCHSEGCGVKGSALSLIGRRLGIFDRRALLEELRRRLGVANEPSTDGSVQDVMARTHRVLLEVAPLSLAARDYLIGRGFDRTEVPPDWTELPAPDEQVGVVRALVEELGDDGWRLSGLADESDPTRFAHADHRLVVPWYGGLGVLAPVALLERVRLAEGSPTSVLPRGTNPPLPYGAEDLGEIAGPDTVLVLVEGPLAVHAARAFAREHGDDWFPLGIPDPGSWDQSWADLARGRDVIVAFDADEDTLAKVWVDLELAGAQSITRHAPRVGRDWLHTLREARGKGGRP